jgi:hypothetical protein
VISAVALIAEASKYLAVREEGVNHGPLIDKWLLACGLVNPKPPKDGYPWCMAFATSMGKDAYGKQWPLPMDASCKDHFLFARKKKILQFVPQVGDLFLLMKENVPDYPHHTGIITEVGLTGTEFKTIEGNSNPQGGREGYGVFERTRSTKLKEIYTFIHWQSIV